jgi:N-acetyl-anhydromuramyl-L-alanine amidase AmpD
MALQKLASIGVRPRSTWQVAVLSVAILSVAGCSRNRQSYRPIFASPVPVAKPCTNCGGSSATVIEEPSGGTVSSVPSLVDTPVSDTPAASSSAPSGGGSGTVRSSTVEKPPKARLDDEPGLNEPMSPAPPAGTGAGTTPPAPPKPVNSGSASGPTLLGPTSSASPAAWDADSQDPVQTGATASSRVRRASSTERLKPFVDESNANELMYPNKADRPWRYIVLHHSAAPTGSYDQIDGEHRKILGIDGCGYHFVIGNGTGSKDGQIEVSQRWNNQKQGAHTRNARTHDADEYGIGICLVGDFDQQPPSARQIAATQALINYLSKRYNISSSNVRTHAHLAATKTVCPGKYFPSEAILNATKDAQAERPVRATWKVVRDTTQR